MTYQALPLETIVDKYIDLYIPLDTVELENKIRTTAKVYSTEGHTFLDIYKDEHDWLSVVNTTLHERGGVLTPSVTLIRGDNVNKLAWYDILAALFKEGYEVMQGGYQYLRQDKESVVLKRPETLLESNKVLIDTMVKDAVEQAMTAHHNAYFDTNKVSKFVEDYQKQEMDKFYANQQRIVTSTLHQKLQAKAAVSGLQGLFDEYTQQHEHVAFNALKQALGNIDNLTAKQLLETNGYTKQTVKGSSPVWVKTT